jgi:CRISPR/Cas system-associated protein Cas10 (large subunit of type III CRISPR-Cas system)
MPDKDGYPTPEDYLGVAQNLFPDYEPDSDNKTKRDCDGCGVLYDKRELHRLRRQGLYLCDKCMREFEEEKDGT